MTNPVCSACGMDGPRLLRSKIMAWASEEPPIVCQGCFFLWYDGPAQEFEFDDKSRRGLDPAKIGAYSLRMRAEGKWPFDEKQTGLNA